MVVGDKDQEKTDKERVLPGVCSDYVVGGHKWVVNDGKVICQKCGAEKE